MNSIIWKGVSSTTINGLIISELPPITKPQMRVQETVIDGRDGSIIEELGYSAYEKSISIGLHGSFDIDAVIKYFTGEGDIVFSNEPDKVYRAKICGKVDYTRLLRYRQASVTFTVQPFKYKLNEYLRETQTAMVSGTSLVTNNNAEDKLKSFKIYGKSTQAGTPTPDAPIDIVSIGDSGTIMVSVADGTDENAQSIVIQTPNGLRGIAVSSGGNYTDANGRKWICDEIDLARGVYIQRVGKKAFNGTEQWAYSSGTNYYILDHSSIGSVVTDRSFCSHFAYGSSGHGNFFSGSAGFAFFHTSNSITEWKAYLSQEFTSGTPVEMTYILATPIETALTEEEIATYKTLMSNILTATITNDENAHMTVEYFKPFEVFNEGLEDSKPLMVLKGSGTVEIWVNGIAKFSYTFPDGENEVYIDSEKEDAYLGTELKNRNMNGEFPILTPKTNIIEWSGGIESISVLPRSRWL